MKGKSFLMFLVLLSMLGSAFMLFVNRILFPIELPVFLMMLLLAILIMMFLPNARAVQFLFAIFFAANLVNTFFVCVSGIKSLMLLFVGIVNLLGVVLLLSARRARPAKAPEPKKKSAGNKAELAKQLGPDEPRPRVTIIPARKRIKKKPVKRRKKR